MPEDVQGAVADSPQPDAQADPSPAQEVDGSPQVSEQTPPPPSQPETKPWNLPPEQRWEDLRRERDEARRAYQELAGRAVQSPPAMAPQPQAVDPWEPLVTHADPQTAQFWQIQKRLADHVAQTTRQQVLQELTPVLDAGRQELARLNLREFRKENPEIKPGSEEEQQIVAYMNGQMDGVRHPLESAKRNAMYDRLEAENRALKGKQSLTAGKAQANGSEASTGMPATAGLPKAPADWRERVRQAARKGGSLLDIANVVG